MQHTVSAQPLTTSSHETSRIYHFGEFEIIVYFFDNRSQREEFRKPSGEVQYFSPRFELQRTEKYGAGTGLDGRIVKAEMEQILKGANNGAAWTLESEQDGGTLSESTKQRILEQGMTEFDRACFKSKGLRVSFETDAHGQKHLVVETEAFRALRLANKPEAQKPAPPKGKGF